MILMPLRKAKPRLERDILNEIRSALAREPGVWIVRNNSGKTKSAEAIAGVVCRIVGIRFMAAIVAALRAFLGNPHAYGLGIGSPDLVGTVSVVDGSRTYPVFFAIEVKRPGKKPTADQVAWMKAATERGVSCGVAHTVGEAMSILSGAKV